MSIERAIAAVDFDLLLLLFALLVTVEILRTSGALEVVVHTAASRFRTTRTFGVGLVLLSGVLACVITNDVALFVVIPFTVIAARFAPFDLERVVILEIIATNLIGCLTPLGNPQNLFIFQRSGWSAVHFIGVMLPFVAWCTIALIVRTTVSPHSQPIVLQSVPPRLAWRGAAVTGVVCFVLVLLYLARLTNAWIAAVAALIAGISVLRRGLLRVDLSIVPLFFFAFIVVEGLRSLGLRPAANVYASSIVLSQFISNVPATILLSPFATNDWRELLYGVSAGGCGTIIASLANLLGWRLYVRESNREPAFLRRLTLVNVAFLGWAAAGGWLLLRFF